MRNCGINKHKIVEKQQKSSTTKSKKFDYLIQHYFYLNGQDFEKTSLSEKVHQTLYSNKFMEFYSYLENCSILTIKCQVGDIF